MEVRELIFIRQSCERFLCDLNDGKIDIYDTVSFSNSNPSCAMGKLETVSTILGMKIVEFPIDHTLLSQILKTMIAYYKSKEPNF